MKVCVSISHLKASVYKISDLNLNPGLLQLSFWTYTETGNKRRIRVRFFHACDPILNIFFVQVLKQTRRVLNQMTLILQMEKLDRRLFVLFRKNTFL